MRKALSLAALATAVLIATAVPAFATLVSPTPPNNSTVSGTVQLKDDGANSAGINLLLTSCNGSTTITVKNSGGTTILNQSVSGSGGQGAPIPLGPIAWVTDNFPNGTYTVNGADLKKTSVCLSSSTTNSTETLTVQNIGSITYGGDSADPTGTNATVKATFTDTNGVAPATGTTVTFALSGQAGTATAVTNAQGVAQTTLPITGSPRSATLTASTVNGFYTAASTTVPFTVQADPTTTTVSSTLNPSTFGQSVGFGATVTSNISGLGTPAGSVQFVVDGTSFGSPVTLVSGHANSGTTTTLGAGNHSVQAVFTPSGSWGNSTGNLTQVVNKASTTTSVTSSVNPSVFGEAITFTAHVAVVAPGTGVPNGTVVFQQNGQPIGSPVTVDGSGNATSTPISVLTVAGSPYNVTATYQESANYHSSSTSLSQEVDKADTSIGVASSASPSVSGQSVTFTVTLSAVDPGAGTPTGSVTFTVDGNPLGSAVTLSPSGQATSDGIANLAPGNHTVSIAYSGDANFNVSTTTFTQEVDQAQTTTTLSSSNNPSVFGQGVTYTAQVAVVAPGAGTPTGTVTFTADGNPIGAPVSVDSTGKAVSDPIASLAVGDHAISAVYSGDTPFAGSSDALTQTVNKAATTTSLDTSVSPSVFGQDVTFTATLAVTSPGAGTPTGSVDFFDGTTLLGTVPVDQAAGAGSAQLTTAGLSVGSHAISAVYSGDDSFNGSTGSTTQGVNKASSSTTITQNGPIVQGQPVTFTASVAFVAPGAGTPTGTVQFKLNGAAQGSPVALDGSGNATSAPINGLTPGGYTITAVYSGDGNLLPSTGTIGQDVNPATTSVTLQSSGSPSSYGSPVTLLATVDIQAGAVGTPTGTVDFYDGGTLLGASDLVDNGGGPQASLTVSNLAVGHHALTAQYLGEADFQGSTSSAIDQAVNGDPTTTAVVSLGNPTVYHSPVTFRATITPSVANPNPVSGLVTFYDGTTAIGSASVAGAGGTGTASITVSNLGAGSHTIKAQYSGDSNFGTSTSPTITQTVTKQGTSTTASITTSKVITATLTSASDGPLAGRTLVFKSGSTTMCTATTNASGVAVCNAGSYSLQITLNGYQVSFAGDANYGSSSFSGH